MTGYEPSEANFVNMQPMSFLAAQTSSRQIQAEDLFRENNLK